MAGTSREQKATETPLEVLKRFHGLNPEETSSIDAVSDYFKTKSIQECGSFIKLIPRSDPFEWIRTIVHKAALEKVFMLEKGDFSATLSSYFSSCKTEGAEEKKLNNHYTDFLKIIPKIGLGHIISVEVQSKYSAIATEVLHQRESHHRKQEDEQVEYQRLYALQGDHKKRRPQKKWSEISSAIKSNKHRPFRFDLFIELSGTPPVYSVNKSQKNLVCKVVTKKDKIVVPLQHLIDMFKYQPILRQQAQIESTFEQKDTSIGGGTTYNLIQWAIHQDNRPAIQFLIEQAKFYYHIENPGLLKLMEVYNYNDTQTQELLKENFIEVAVRFGTPTQVVKNLKEYTGLSKSEREASPLKRFIEQNLLTIAIDRYSETTAGSTERAEWHNCIRSMLKSNIRFSGSERLPKEIAEEENKEEKREFKSSQHKTISELLEEDPIDEEKILEKVLNRHQAKESKEPKEELTSDSLFKLTKMLLLSDSMSVQREQAFKYLAQELTDREKQVRLFFLAIKNNKLDFLLLLTQIEWEIDYYQEWNIRNSDRLEPPAFDNEISIEDYLEFYQKKYPRLKDFHVISDKNIIFNSSLLMLTALKGPEPEVSSRLSSSSATILPDVIASPSGEKGAAAITSSASTPVAIPPSPSNNDNSNNVITTTHVPPPAPPESKKDPVLGVVAEAETVNKGKAEELLASTPVDAAIATTDISTTPTINPSSDGNSNKITTVVTLPNPISDTVCLESKNSPVPVVVAGAEAGSGVEAFIQPNRKNRGGWWAVGGALLSVGGGIGGYFLAPIVLGGAFAGWGATVLAAIVTFAVAGITLGLKKVYDVFYSGNSSPSVDVDTSTAATVKRSLCLTSSTNALPVDYKSGNTDKKSEILTSHVAAATLASGEKISLLEIIHRISTLPNPAKIEQVLKGDSKNHKYIGFMVNGIPEDEWATFCERINMDVLRDFGTTTFLNKSGNNLVHFSNCTPQQVKRYIERHGTSKNFNVLLKFPLSFKIDDKIFSKQEFEKNIEALSKSLAHLTYIRR